MNVAVAKTGTERHLSDVFALARGRLPGDGRVAEVRQAAIEAYERLGLPHRRVEEWKYTDLRALMREVLPLAPLPDTAALARARVVLASVAMVGAQKLVLVDGVVVARQELSGDRPGEFFERDYPIPETLTKDKASLRIRFEPEKGLAAGPVFGLRLYAAGSN